MPRAISLWRGSEGQVEAFVGQGVGRRRLRRAENRPGRLVEVWRTITGS